MNKHAIRTSARGVLRPGKWLWLRALLWMLLCFVVTALILSLQSLVRALNPDPALVLAMAFVCTALAYLAYAGLVRWGERRSPAELSLRALPLELALGLVIGGLLFSAVFAILLLIGAYTVAPGVWNDWPHDIREALGTGFLEELIARLILFRLLMAAFGERWALGLSAMAFGAAHLGNANASPFAAAAIAVEAGLMLAAFFLLTGRIWMSIGVHAAWNFTQGAVFGAQVSGMTGAGSLLVSRPSTTMPALLTGGAFGPEASLPAIVVGLAAFAGVMLLRPRPATPSGTAKAVNQP